MVRVVLNGVVAVFHKPHPQKETYKSAVRRVRRFFPQGEAKRTDRGGRSAINRSGDVLCSSTKVIRVL
jgi:hypothetical protein